MNTGEQLSKTLNKAMKSFIKDNEKVVSSFIIDLVRETIEDDLSGRLGSEISQSLEWYQSEVKHYFNKSMDEAASGIVKKHIDDMVLRIDSEVVDLMTNEKEFRQAVKKEMSKKIKVKAKAVVEDKDAEISDLLDRIIMGKNRNEL